MKKQVAKAKMVKPNLIGSKEVEAVKAKYPNAELTQEIPFHNRKHYNFMGLTLVKKGGIDSELKIKVFTKDVNDWEGMGEEQKKSFTGLFGQLIIIHDPNIETESEVIEEEVAPTEEETTPLVVKKKKAEKKAATGRMTDAKEKKIQKAFEAYVVENMNEEDESLTISKEFIDELSQKHNVPVEKIKEYLEQLATQEEEVAPTEEETTPSE